MNWHSPWENVWGNFLRKIWLGLDVSKMSNIITNTPALASKFEKMAKKHDAFQFSQDFC
jgi:hypothetical protein